MLLGLDLAKTSLGDALEAMFEAWHLAQEDAISEYFNKELYSFDELQKLLGKSRASIYRAINTCKDVLNPDHDPDKINYEYRRDKQDPMQFSIHEIERWKRRKQSLPKKATEKQLPDVSQVQTPRSLARELAKSWDEPADSSISPKDHIIDTTTFMISSGALKPGDKMPSVRDMAEKIACHRNTVLSAYQEMEIGGILSSKRGSGFYVSASNTQPLG
jgi:predicted DNA-binding protein YlxM (UPF0122 family)